MRVKLSTGNITHHFKCPRVQCDGHAEITHRTLVTTGVPTCVCCNGIKMVFVRSDTRMNDCESP